jgi:hypothetical protein
MKFKLLTILIITAKNINYNLYKIKIKKIFINKNAKTLMLFY